MEPASSGPGPLTLDALLRRAGGSLLLNAACPWIAFQILTWRGVSTATALAATAVFPLVGTLIGWVRLGRPDIVGVLSALFIGLSLAVALATDNPLVLLLRSSVTGTMFAVLCFGSLALSRPLMFHVARQYVAGWDHAAFARFGARWEQPGFRRAMRRLTLAWGCWFVAQAVGRAAAVTLLDVPTFLSVWPFMTSVGTVAMIFWSVNDGRRDAEGSAWSSAEHGAHLGAAAREALDRAAEEAKRLRHGYVGTEHLLIALCDDQDTAPVLRNVRVTREAARATLETVVGPGNAPVWQEIAHAPRLRSALRRAFDVHQATGADEIGTDHLLIGLIDEADGQAASLLAYMGVDLPGLRARLVDGAAAR